MTIAPFDPLYGAMSRGPGQGGQLTLDPELRLLLAACSCAWDRAAPPKTAGLAGEKLDWPRLLRLARFHRVEGLVWQGLERAGARVPEAERSELKRLAQQIAARNLAMLENCRALRHRFEQAGVSVRFVKGLTLAKLAYDDIGAKSSADIDLLVNLDDIGRAATLLEALGYRLASPAPRYRAQIGEWHRLSKESTWLSPAFGVGVDLHSALADNGALIPSIGMSSAPRLVEAAPGITLPTLPAAELAAYLAVHGAYSAWFRLKWICDFAALVSREHQGRLPSLYAEMRSLGAGRCADQALLLADRLFGTLSSEPGLRRSLCASWASRRLLEIASASLSEGGEPIEPTETRFGTVPLHLSQFLLRGDPSFLGAEAAKIGQTLARRFRFSRS